MKSIKNIIFAVMVVLVLVAQVGYLLTVYKDDKAVIDTNKAEITSIERRIAQLEERVRMLPETQKELELVTAKKMAMLNTIPTFTASSKETADLFRYMGLKDFMDKSVKLEEDSEGISTEDELIFKSKYELGFVGRYKDVRDFVDSLNASYQIINVQEFEINNEIQGREGAEVLPYIYHFGDDFDQIVEAKIKLTMYTRINEEDVDEIYQPTYDGRITTDNNFKRALRVSDKEGPSVGQTTEPTKPETQESDRVTASDVFTLNVGDIFTSGDTYKLGGPGIGGYVGLISQVNTHISLVIRDDGYEMSIEDENGNVKQTSVSMSITNPGLNIISTMREIEQVMPNVHVYIYNYTANIMDVKLSGSLLENIHVFNELDQQVRVGQTKGNIRVS